MTAALEGDEWSAARPGRTLPPGKARYSFLQEAGWAPGPVWTGGKSCPYRDSILDRPARSQSLYLLSYPDKIVRVCKTYKKRSQKMFKWRTKKEWLKRSLLKGLRLLGFHIFSSAKQLLISKVLLFLYSFFLQKRRRHAFAKYPFLFSWWHSPAIQNNLTFWRLMSTIVVLPHR